MIGRPDIGDTATGQEIVARIGADLSLTALTALVDETCRRAEERHEPTTVVLELGHTTAEKRGWPGGSVVVREVSRWEKALRRLERLGAVTISTLTGTCGGPALDVLLATDRRICARGAHLLFPINQGQFWPGMSLYRLTNHVGRAHARRMILWGSEITAEQALAAGLVDEITADVSYAVRSLAVLMSRESAVDLAIRRQLLLEASESSYEDALGAHLAACDRELRRIRDEVPAGEAER
jgi:isomerase DpgB